MLRGACIAAVLLVAVVGTAQAQDWRGWERNGYTVGSTDTGCGIIAEYPIEGRSATHMLLFYEGSRAYLSLSNYDWSIEEDAEFDDFQFYFRGPDRLYDGGETRGIKVQHRPGITTPFNETVLDAFAQADHLIVAREGDADPIIVADLGLDGSGEAIRQLRSCKAFVDNRNAEKDRRERANDYIARDPFADPETPSPEERINERLRQFEAPPVTVPGPSPRSEP